jgi:hypothetical protein
MQAGETNTGRPSLWLPGARGGKNGLTRGARRSGPLYPEGVRAPLVHPIRTGSDGQGAVFSTQRGRERDIGLGEAALGEAQWSRRRPAARGFDGGGRLSRPD